MRSPGFRPRAAAAPATRSAACASALRCRQRSPVGADPPASRVPGRIHVPGALPEPLPAWRHSEPRPRRAPGSRWSGLPTPGEESTSGRGQARPGAPTQPRPEARRFDGRRTNGVGQEPLPRVNKYRPDRQLKQDQRPPTFYRFPAPGVQISPAHRVPPFWQPDMCCGRRARSDRIRRPGGGPVELADVPSTHARRWNARIGRARRLSPDRDTL